MDAKKAARKHSKAALYGSGHGLMREKVEDAFLAGAAWVLREAAREVDSDAATLSHMADQIEADQ